MNNTEAKFVAWIVTIGMILTIISVALNTKSGPAPVKVPPAPVIEIVTPVTSDTIDDILDVNP